MHFTVKALVIHGKSGLVLAGPWFGQGVTIDNCGEEFDKLALRAWQAWSEFEKDQDFPDYRMRMEVGTCR